MGNPNKKAEFRRDVAAFREEIILERGAAAFVKKGLSQASMADVAAEIGISRASLYSYFRSKDEIVGAILERMAGRLLSQDAVEFRTLGHGIALSLRIARESPHAYLLLIRFAAGEPRYASYRRAYHDVILERTLERATRFFGDPRNPHLRRVAAQSVIAFIESSVANWIETGSEAEDQEFIAWSERALGVLFKEWGYHEQDNELRRSRTELEIENAPRAVEELSLG